jgi:hypothetical protein
MARPRTYPAEVAQDGAPVLTVRLEPELLAWVKAKGGVQWLRQHLRELMAEEG